MTYVYVSQTSRGGSDANDGISPRTPKLTLAAASALLASAGDVLFVDRKSTFVGEKIDAVDGCYYDGWSWDYDVEGVPTLLSATNETRVEGNKAAIDRNSVAAGTYCIQCLDVDDVTIAGFNIIQGENVFIRRGACANIVLCNVIVTDPGVSSFTVYDDVSSVGSCTFYGCTSEGNSNGDGFTNRHDTADTAIGCLASGHDGISPAGDGWTSHNGSGWTLLRCISRNNTDGADMTGSGAHLITDSTFDSNLGDGVKTGSAAPLTIRGSTMNSNGGWGLRMDGSGAVVSERCTTNSNGQDGVTLTSTSNFTATHHTSNSNVAAGFRVIGTTTTRNFTRCVSNLNGTNGVHVTVPGTYTIDGHEAIANVGSGILFNPTSSSSVLNLYNSVLVSPTTGLSNRATLEVPTAAAATVLVEAYNNTFHNRHDGGAINHYSIFFGSTVTLTLDLVSNVFAAHMTNSRAYHIIMNGTVAVQAVAINRNVYKPVTSNHSRFRDGAVSTYTFATWQAVVGTPDLNSLNTDPAFYGLPADTIADHYRIPLLSSPAKTVAGSNLFSSGVSRDFRGRHRPSSGNWQAGAFLVGVSAGSRLNGGVLTHIFDD